MKDLVRSCSKHPLYEHLPHDAIDEKLKLGNVSLSFTDIATQRSVTRNIYCTTTYHTNDDLPTSVSMVLNDGYGEPVPQESIDIVKMHNAIGCFILDIIVTYTLEIGLIESEYDDDDVFEIEHLDILKNDSWTSAIKITVFVENEDMLVQEARRIVETFTEETLIGPKDDVHRTRINFFTILCDILMAQCKSQEAIINNHLTPKRTRQD